MCKSLLKGLTFHCLTGAPTVDLLDQEKSHNKEVM